MLPGVGVSSAEVTNDNKLSVKLSSGQEVSSIFINIYRTSPFVHGTKFLQISQILDTFMKIKLKPEDKERKNNQKEEKIKPETKTRKKPEK